MTSPWTLTTHSSPPACFTAIICQDLCVEGSDSLTGTATPGPLRTRPEESIGHGPLRHPHGSGRTTSTQAAGHCRSASGPKAQSHRTDRWLSLIHISEPHETPEHLV